MSVNNWIQLVCCFNLATLIVSIVLHTRIRAETAVRRHNTEENQQ